MLFNEGVSILGIRPETILGIQIADALFRSQGHILLVTSVLDGVHGKDSLHYRGLAFDCRRWGLSEVELTHLVTGLRNVLPHPFQVVLEQTHIHIEYDHKV